MGILLLGFPGTAGQCEGVLPKLGVRGAATFGGRLHRHPSHALHRRRKRQGTGISHTCVFERKIEKALVRVQILCSTLEIVYTQYGL